MKIKTRLEIIIIITVVVCSFVILFNLFLYRQTSQLSEKEDLATELQLALFERAQLRNDYFMSREERAKEQWRLTNTNILSILEKMSGKFKEPQERAVLSNLALFNDRLVRLFDQLDKLDEGTRAPVTQTQELRERIISQMVVSSSSQYLEGLKLKNAVQEKREQWDKKSRLYSNALFVLLALSIVYFAVIIIRSITHPLRRLHEGTEIIAEGNLDYKTNIRTPDEIGQLSNAFDVMTERLKDITVSRNELNIEVEARRKAEESLRKEKDFAESLIKTAQAIVLVLDTTGSIVSFNPYMEEISGCTLKEVQGKDWFSTFLPERDRNSKIELFLKAINDIQTRGNVNPIVTKDGRELQIEWNDKTLKDEKGNVVGLLSVGQDITIRKQAEEALRESEERFRGLFNHMSSGVAVYEAIDNGGDFIFRNFNPAAEKIEKVSREDIIGKCVSEAFPGVKAFGVFEVFQRVWQTGKPEYFPQNIYKDERDPGSWRESWVFKLPAGEVVALYNDITDRKQAEEKIKTSLLEKETMLKEIHHRVKNNLQVISSLLDLQSSYLQDEKAREMLQNSMDRVRTMAMIHTQLYQSPDLTGVDFGSFIWDLTGNISQSYGRTASPVEIKVDAGEIRLGIDASIPCGLILNELVSNALKHAFPEGKEGQINIRMRSQDNQIVLTVQDNGIGFPESIDLKNVKSLGLELVNILVGQMNGKIDMQVHGGTTWNITFPVKNEREWRNG